MLSRKPIAAFTIALLVGAASVQASSVTTAPSNEATMVAANEAYRARLAVLHAAVEANTEKLSAVTTEAILSDPQRRAEVAPQARELLAKQLSVNDAYIRSTPHAPDQRELQRLEALQYLFGDGPTVARIDEMAAGKDAVAGGTVRLHASWLGAGGDPVKQKAVAAEADRFGALHPTDTQLTERIAGFIRSSQNVEIREALIHTTTVTMHNNVSEQIVKELEATKSMVSAQAAAAKQQARVGQPMIIAGPTVDGHPFSTADFKGKVILVDFWATWCGPCKAELPRVKAFYDQYHDKGFEVVGVSSDESADPLNKYVAEHHIPWTQLFDAGAAAAGEKQQPLAKAFDIALLPTMFVIDRHGVCRTVTGRNEFETLVPKLLAE